MVVSLPVAYKADSDIREECKVRGTVHRTADTKTTRPWARQPRPTLDTAKREADRIIAVAGPEVAGPVEAAATIQMPQRQRTRTNTTHNNNTWVDTEHNRTEWDTKAITTNHAVDMVVCKIRICSSNNREEWAMEPAAFKQTINIRVAIRKETAEARSSSSNNNSIREDPLINSSRLVNLACKERMVGPDLTRISQTPVGRTKVDGVVLLPAGGKEVNKYSYMAEKLQSKFPISKIK
jgi:hypothetical protein